MNEKETMQKTFLMQIFINKSNNRSYIQLAFALKIKSKNKFYLILHNISEFLIIYRERGRGYVKQLLCKFYGKIILFVNRLDIFSSNALG